MSDYRYKHEDWRRRTEGKAAHQERGGHKKMKVKAKDTPGVICVERHSHEEAIVISGSLTVDFTEGDLREWIAEELEKVSLEIVRLDGIAEQIKAAITIASTCIVSVTDEKAVVKDPYDKRGRITLSAIVYKIRPEDAVDIVRNALAAVRLRLRKRRHDDIGAENE